MNVQVPAELSLEKELHRLQEQLAKSQANLDDFRNTYRALQKARQELQELLQWGAEQKRDDKEFNRLYRQVAGWNASDLIESLKRTGFALGKDSDLKDAFERQGYRILELVRAGKRDEVFHAVLRIFVSAKKSFPIHLVEAFKPVYSDELFKVFLFSFLSGVLVKEQETDND